MVRWETGGLISITLLTMGGPPEPREARSEGKLHDPPSRAANTVLVALDGRLEGRPW